MRIMIRTSKWAIWARRLGSFCIPLLILPILMHRQLMIESDAFVVALAIAMGVGALAILCGLIAFARLWQTGDRGWGRASAGILLGLVCLSPLAYGAWAMPRFPQVSDVTTSPPDTPPMIFESGASNSLAAPETAEHFPNAVPRSYQMPAEQIFMLVQNLVAQRGWSVRQERTPASNRPGYVAAVATTWLGWRDGVVIQVRDDISGALVSMRSASLARVPGDLGKNGTRIEAFLVDLDEAVSEAARSTAPTVSPDEAAEPSS